MAVVIVGMNHRKAPVEIREKLYIADPSNLKDEFLELGLEEGCILSTCNRVEIHGAGDGLISSKIKQWLMQRTQIFQEDLSCYLYTYTNADAIRHVFRVASSLDSMVLGETEILGQVKSAYQASHQLGMVGPRLHRMYQKAFRVAKRVRTETLLGKESVSVATMAVRLSEKIFSSLRTKKVLVLGAGEMAQAVIGYLRERGVKEFYVSNRSPRKEEGFTYLPLESFHIVLDRIDMILASTASPDYLVTVPMLKNALKQRKNQPIFCVDISVPRNIDPEINALDHVYLYDIDDLENLVSKNIEKRKHEAEKAEGIIIEEVKKFMKKSA